MRASKILLGAVFSVLFFAGWGGQSSAETPLAKVPPAKTPPAREAKQDPAAQGDTCEDGVGSDGKSYTAWCKKNVVGKPKGSPVSCWAPAMVQNRCMKSCGLCK